MTVALFERARRPAFPGGPTAPAIRLALVLAFALCGGIPRSAGADPQEPPAARGELPVYEENWRHLRDVEDLVWVGEVELRGAEGADRDAYRQLLAVEPGEPLTRRAVRRTIQRLFETGRFSNVTAFTASLGPSPLDRNEVKLVIILEPRRPIVNLQFAGATRLSAETLRRASGLTPGMELSEDRMEAASEGIRQAFAALGFEEATVELRSTPAAQGIDVSVAVAEGTPTRLSRLDLRGEPGDAALWQSALTMKTGDILDRNRLGTELAALRRRYREAGYYRARVGQPEILREATGSARVAVDVEAGPRITLAIRGNRAIDDSRLRGYLAYEGEEYLDAGMLADLAMRLQKRYRQAGFYDARVVHAEETSRDGSQARITFHVNEGSPLLVQRLIFHGNRNLDDLTLRSLAELSLSTSLEPFALFNPLGRGELDRARGVDRRGLGRRIDPLLIFDDDAYQKVVDEMTARYRDEGFLDVRVHRPEVTIDEVRRLATVEIRIDEGRRSRIRRLEYPGASALEPAKLLSRSTAVALGRPVSERLIEERRVELRSLYARSGYLYAVVTTELVRPPDNPTAVHLLFHVNEGPLVRVGQMVVQGNKRTDPVVFDENLELAEGEVLGSEALATSRQRLMRLGLFRTVTVRPLDPDVPEPVKDMVIEVQERPTWALELGAGASIADGPRAFSELTKRNIFGRDLQLSLRGRMNYQVFRDEVVELPFEDGLERFVDLGLSYPRIYGLPIPLGARLDLIHELDIRLAFRMNRYAAVTGLDWPISSKVKASLLYELESTFIERSPRIDDLYANLSRADLTRLRFPNGDTLLGSVRPSLVLNLQDDPVLPHSGLFVKLEADFARDLGGDTTVDFAKVSGTITGYIPLGSRTTLVLSGSGGQVFPLRDDSQTIAPKRFYLGGSGSLRGFSEDAVVPEDLREVLRKEIADCEALLFNAGCSQAARFLQQDREVLSTGGEVFALLRAELRFPIQGALMGGIFTDAGNLFSDPSLVDLETLRLRTSVGAGLRYATPVGPVALDFGFNLDPDPVLREAPFALHFSIGLF